MLPAIFFPALLITLLFFLSGFEKIINFSKTVDKFAKKMSFPLAFAQVIISCVILLEIGAPTLISAYLSAVIAVPVLFFQLALIALMLFTVLATILYHNPLKNKENYYAFISNVSTLGGLMALYIAA